jgi:tetratricopeptide (TPR) repeat protein
LLDNALKTADAAQQKQMLQEALPQLQRAIELHPTYYDALLAYGACTYYLRQFDQAVYGYRKAAQLYPGDGNAKTGLVYALQAHGQDLWAKGDSLASVSILDEAWTMQPDSVIAILLAGYYHAIGQPEKSREWQDKAGSRMR